MPPKLSSDFLAADRHGDGDPSTRAPFSASMAVARSHSWPTWQVVIACLAIDLVLSALTRLSDTGLPFPLMLTASGVMASAIALHSWVGALGVLLGEAIFIAYAGPSAIPVSAIGLVGGSVLGLGVRQALSLRDLARSPSVFLQFLLMAAAVSALAAVGGISFGSFIADFRLPWAVWFAIVFGSGLLGPLYVMPLLLGFSFEQRSPPQTRELIAVMLALPVLIGLSAWRLHNHLAEGGAGYPLVMVLMPLGLAALAMRWRVREVAIPMAALAIVPIVALNQPLAVGWGILARVEVAMQTYLVVAVLCTLVVALTTSERRTLTLQLGEEERRYRRLVDSAPEAILVVDLDQHVIIDANAQASRITGYDYEELLSLPPEALFLPPPTAGSADHDKTPAARFAALIAQLGEPQELKDYAQVSAGASRPDPRSVPPSLTADWVLRDRFGEEIDCELRIVRMPGRSRRRLRMSLVDVSLRKQFEAERVRAQEDKLAMQQLQQLQMHLLPVAYVVCDGDMKIQAWNPAAEKLFGWPSAEAIGQALPEIVAAGEDLRRFAERFGRMRESDVILRGTVRGRARDGRNLVCD